MFPDKEVSNSLNFASSVVPFKDVDGLHPINLGRIASRSCMPDFFPCTALGIIELLRYYRIELSGLKAAVIGRSDIVGMPTSLLLSRLDATVTLCHSKTTNVPMILKESDIIIAAIGKPNFIQADWLRPGAVIIDVGINRMTRPDGRMKLVGDVDFDGAIKVASAITPVPGGVGPLTVAMLVRNLFHAALRARGIESKEKCMVI